MKRPICRTSCRASPRMCWRSSSSTATRPTTPSPWHAPCCPRCASSSSTAQGKGAALRTGFAAARGDIIVMLDADGSTAPEEIPSFVRALDRRRRLRQGVTVPRRRWHCRHAALPQARQRDLRGAWSGCCSAVATPTCATATTPSGVTSCRELGLDGDGFEIETMMNVRALKIGLKVAEVPSFESHAYPRRVQPAHHP